MIQIMILYCVHRCCLEGADTPDVLRPIYDKLNAVVRRKSVTDGGHAQFRLRFSSGGDLKFMSTVSTS
jgi:hypothetical protein